MTTLKANRKFPNPITVTDDPRSHTLALQQVIEALNVGQRRTREVGSSYVRVSELVDMGLIEIVGNQLKLTNTGAAIAGGSTTLAALTDVDLTGLADGDTLVYDSVTATWLPGGGGGGPVDGSDMYGVSLNDLADVSFYLPNNGDVLTYNADLGVWECHPVTDTIEITAFFAGRPADGQVLLYWHATELLILPGNFVGAYGYIRVNPTATVTLNVAINGSNFGTISISTSGVFTFATTSGAQQGVAVGDRISITNQATSDVTAADIGVTLVGTMAS